MSKLYVSAITDAIDAYRTARGHKEASITVSYNFSGGTTPDGSVELECLHRDTSLLVRVIQWKAGTRLWEQEFTIDKDGAHGL